MTIRPVWDEDLDELEQLERACYGDCGFDRLDFDSVRKRDGWIMLVAVFASPAGIQTVVGYLIYELRGERSFSIDNIAVHPEFRRSKVGSQLVLYLAKKIDGRRKQITAIVHEKDLEALAFFKRCEFRAVRVIRRAIGPDDGYLMRYINHYEARPLFIRESLGLKNRIRGATRWKS